MQKLFGSRQAPCGSETDEPLWTTEKGTKELGEMLRMILKSQEGEVPDGEGQGSMIAGEKTRLWNIAKKSMLADIGALLEDGAQGCAGVRA